MAAFRFFEIKKDELGAVHVSMELRKEDSALFDVFSHGRAAGVQAFKFTREAADLAVLAFSAVSIAAVPAVPTPMRVWLADMAAAWQREANKRQVAL